MRNELTHGASRFSELDWQRLWSGTQLDASHLKVLPAAMDVAMRDQRIREALVHFGQSRSLFDGYMVGSYYHSHYAPERRAMRKIEVERSYFEDRARFELAIVAAFKAVEAMFGGVQIRENKLDKEFNSIPYARITPRARYRRYHEIFRGERRTASYRDMILHFLHIRNATAAHSNRTPPPALMVTEDTVYEIQWFVSELILQALRSTLGAELPTVDLPAVNRPGGLTRARS
jgi:hypothetical protein